MCELPRGHYPCILADPPWAFRTFSGETMTPHRCAEDHYKTMELAEMQALPTGDIAEPRMGFGYWTRKQVEPCWLFTRGNPRRVSKGVRQLIVEPRREHSRKPDAQYERIEALVEGPRLELFARQKRPGWDCWGNQTDKFEAAA